MSNQVLYKYKNLQTWLLIQKLLFQGRLGFEV